MTVAGTATEADVVAPSKVAGILASGEGTSNAPRKSPEDSPRTRNVADA